MQNSNKSNIEYTLSKLWGHQQYARELYTILGRKGGPSPDPHLALLVDLKRAREVGYSSLIYLLDVNHSGVETSHAESSRLLVIPEYNGRNL